MDHRVAIIEIVFCPPQPPDGMPNFRPHGFHVYRVYDEAGRKLVSGSFGPDREQAVAWALKMARDKGFTSYRMRDDAR